MPRATRRLVAAAGFVGVALLALRGCDCGGAGGTLGQPCGGGFDCDPGQICVDDVCVLADGGGEGRADPGADGPRPEGGDGAGPGARMGPGTDNPFEPGPDNSDGVGTDDAGDLILTDEWIRLQYLWVANSGEGTVSKIDTFADPPAEVGRFHTGLDERKADPSRTSVDLAGDVFVANRAHNYPAGAEDISSLTKIAAQEERCVDRNRNGVIDTSHGSTPLPRGDGSGGVPAGQSTDECVLWTRDFRPAAARPTDAVEAQGCVGARAVAATPETGLDYEVNGHVWVGCYDSRRIYKLHGNTGDLLDTADVSPCGPYGMLMGLSGATSLVWICCRDMGDGAEESISSFDPATRALTPLAPAIPDDPYGFAMDASGNFWVGTMPPEPSAVLRYRPGAGWESLAEPMPDFFEDMRGAAVDEWGYAWLVSTDRHETWLIDPATFPAAASLLEVLPTTNDPGSRATDVSSGVAVDFEGNIWTVSMGEGDADGWVTKYTVDRSGGRPVVDVAGHPERLQMVRVGRNPYTYSDMIGYHLRHFTTREGWYRQVFEACPGYSVRWNKIGWDAYVPPGTRMVLRGRTADRREDLVSAVWVRLAEVPDDESPVDIPLGVPPAGLGEGHFIEIEIRLYSDRDDLTPRVHAIWFDWTCTTPIY